MKKFLALSFALALTFSTTVCAAETVVPTKDFSRLDTLADCAEKSLPEYTSNAVSGPNIGGAWKISDIASGSDMIIAGKQTNATCVVDKVDYPTALYAMKKGWEVRGVALAAVNLSAPGVDLTDAQVKLYVENVAAGDAISVYKCVKGEWVAVDIVEVADESVTIPFDFQGAYTIIKGI